MFSVLFSIRDGSSNSAPQVGKICGSRGLGFNYTSLGRSLYIRFRSDTSVTSRGFRASWTNAGSGQGRMYCTCVYFPLASAFFNCYGFMVCSLK